MIATANRTTKLCYCALGVVLIAICSWIAIPMTVPFTLQTFGIFAVLRLLGGRLGTASIVCYLLLGFAGLPVFANFSAGIGVLTGPTGGYLVGFLFMGLLYWLFEKLLPGKDLVRAAVLLLGLLVLYGFGTMWFILVFLQSGTSMTIGAVLGMCVLPFVVPDLVKLLLSGLLARRVEQALSRKGT